MSATLRRNKRSYEAVSLKERVLILGHFEIDRLLGLSLPARADRQGPSWTAVPSLNAQGRGWMEGRLGFLSQPRIIRLRVPGASQKCHCEEYRVGIKMWTQVWWGKRLV